MEWPHPGQGGSPLRGSETAKLDFRLPASSAEAAKCLPGGVLVTAALGN